MAYMNDLKCSRESVKERNMSTKEECLTNLITEVFAVNSPKIGDARRPAVEAFIRQTINGDNPLEYLAIAASLTKDKLGTLVYVLTNLRLIKIEIDALEIKSSSFPINTISGFERTLEGDRAGVKISFQTGSFGLTFSAANDKINDFFQKVDQTRAKEVS